MNEYADCPPDYDADYRAGFEFGSTGIGENLPDFSYERDEYYQADWWWRTGMFDGYKQSIASQAVEEENAQG